MHTEFWIRTISGLTNLQTQLTQAQRNKIINPPVLSSALTGNPSTLTYNYNDKGQLTFVSDAEGGDITSLYYDDLGRQYMVEDPLGNQDVTQYDNQGRVKYIIRKGKIDGGAGSVAELSREHYVYDTLGRRIQTNRKVFLPDGVSGRLQRSVNLAVCDDYPADAMQNDKPATTGIWLAERVDYDALGRVVKTTNDNRKFSTVEYDGLDRVITATDAQGNTVENHYDANGNLIEAVRTDGATVAGTDAEVFHTTRFYDSLGRMVLEIDNAGRATDVRYNSLSQAIAIADPMGPNEAARTFYRRDTTQNPAAVLVNNFGNVSLMDYDWAGRKIKEERILTASAKGDGVHIGATTEGETDTPPTPDNSQGGGDGKITTLYSFSNNGNLIGLTDDNGNKTEWTYDCQGRKLSEKKGVSVAPSLADRDDPDTTIYWAYDRDGKVTRMTREDGAFVDYTYDAANRPTRIAISNRPAEVIGTTQQDFEYDGAGRQTKAVDNNTGAAGDLVKVTKYYDSLGRKVEETLRVGSTGTTRTTTSDWDSLYRSSIVYPNGRRIDFTYHDSGALESVGDNAQSPVAEYDYIGGRVLVRAMENWIDLEMRNGSGTHFDALGRPLKHWHRDTALPGAPVAVGFEHAYDRAGNKTYQYASHNPTDSFRYFYDSAYRLMRSIEGEFDPPADSRFRNVQVDGAGNLDFNTLTLSGYDIQDAGGTAAVEDGGATLRLSGNTWKKIEFAYPVTADTVIEFDFQSSVEGEIHGMGLDTDNSLDTGHLFQLYGTQPFAIQTYNDYSGMAWKHYTIPVGSHYTGSMQYMFFASDHDALPITTVDPRNTKWSLDGVGNWSQLAVGYGGTTSTETRLDTSFNEYYDVGGVSQSHDVNGNLTANGTKAYKWDAMNRLREAYDNSSWMATYTYDAYNRRVRRESIYAVGVDTEFYYDGWQVVQERAMGSESPTRQFVYGVYIDEPLAMDVNEDGDAWCNGYGDARYFYHQNTLYSVYALTDPSGNIVEAYEYDPYGKPTVITGPGPDSTWFTSDDWRDANGVSNGAIRNPYFFTGQRFDQGVGLYYYKNRYYDGEQGRFISRDPLESIANVNSYEYSDSDPISYVDAIDLIKWKPGEEVPPWNLDPDDDPFASKSPTMQGNADFRRADQMASMAARKYPEASRALTHYLRGRYYPDERPLPFNGKKMLRDDYSARRAMADYLLEAAAYARNNYPPRGLFVGPNDPPAGNKATPQTLYNIRCSGAEARGKKLE